MPKFEFSVSEVRTLQKAMALFSGFATKNDRPELKNCLSVLKKILEVKTSG